MRFVIGAAMFCLAGVVNAQPRMTKGEVVAAAERIDHALDRALAMQSNRNINSRDLEAPMSKPATDEAFLRRASIDLAGRLPTATEAREFVADASENKRALAIGRLLSEPGAGDWRFQRMAEPLRVTDNVLGVSQAAYLKWLRQVLSDDIPYDQLMARLLEARGTLAENPAAGFLLRDSGHVEITTAELARAFLGQDIHCAGCHDHPFSDHTQRGFYEFAACFNIVRSRSDLNASSALPEETMELADTAMPLRLPSSYLYRDAKPGDEVSPAYLPLVTFPEGDPRSALLARPSKERLRQELVLWLTSRENGSFTSVAAVRIWDWMFGVPGRLIAERQEAGFSDPEPPRLIWKGKGCGQAMAFGYGPWLETQKEFVADLRREFENCDCRIGEFQRVLAHTRVYQREAIPADPPGLNRLLPAPVIRRLPAEVLWDALVSRMPPQGQSKLWRTSIELPQVPASHHPLRIMGRGSREWADESRLVISHHLARLMITFPEVAKLTAANSSLLAGAVRATDPQDQVEYLFLDILGRYPLEKERALALRHLATHPETSLQDIAWALLNTTEFLFRQ